MANTIKIKRRVGGSGNLGALAVGELGVDIDDNNKLYVGTSAGNKLTALPTSGGTLSGTLNAAGIIASSIVHGTGLTSNSGLTVSSGDTVFQGSGGVDFNGGPVSFSATAHISSTVKFAAGSSGTLAKRTGYDDFIGYNASYGSYIGGGAGNAARYLAAGGSFYDGSTWRTLYHTGNLPQYLPLTGGTITNTSQPVLKTAYNADHYLGIGHHYIDLNFSSYTNDLELRTGGTPRLTIHRSTGNATFSGTLTATGGTLSGQLSITGDTNPNGQFLTTISNTGTQSEDNGLLVTTATNNASSNVLKVESTGNANTFIVKGNGNVGIGLSSGAITSKLHVNGGITSTGLSVAGSSSFQGAAFTSAITTSSNVSIATGTNKLLVLNPAISTGGSITSIAFQRGGTDKWRVFQYEADSKLSFYNDISSLHQLALNSDGSTTFGGTITATGGTLTGELTSRKVAPSANNTYSSGGANYRWSNVYSVAGDFSGNLTVSGSCTFAALSGTSATFSGTITGHGSIDLQDNDKLLLGAGNDLEIYHDGSNNYINSVIANGDLILDTAQNFYIKHSGETMLQCVNDGAVNLFHDNVKKFETTSDGVKTSKVLIEGTASYLLDVQQTATAWTGRFENNGGAYGLSIDTINNIVNDVPNLACYTPTGTGFFVSNRGRAGLGLTTPQYKLDIGGTNSSTSHTIRIAQNNGGTAIRIGAGGGSSDVTLLRVDGESSDGNHDGATDSSKYGFSLRYMGTRSANANSLSLFSDNQTAGSQVEALMVMQDGSIGVNCTPSYRLQVNGDVRINNGDSFLDDGQSIRWGGTKAKIIGSNGGDYLKFYTDATERLSIASDGKLGLGRSQPSARIDILDPTDGGVYWSTFLRVGRRNGHGTNELELKTQQSSAGDQVGTFGLFMHGVEALAVDSSKRLYLNALPPSTYADSQADDFVLGNTGGHGGLTIRSSSGTAGNIFFADGVNGDQKYRGYLIYDHPNERFQIGVGASARLWVDTEGLKFASNHYIRNSDGIKQIRFRSGGANEVVFNEDGRSDVDVRMEGDSNANLFFLDSSTDRIGIGTSAPISPLTVDGADGIYVRHTDHAGIAFDDTNIVDGSTPITYLSGDGGSLVLGRANRNSSTGRRSASAASITISNSGLVGIGTVPSHRLEVHDASNQPVHFTSGSSELHVKCGSNTQSQFTNLLLYSNGGNAQVWKAGTGYTAYGGANSLNIYNSSGSIAFHPSGNANKVVIDTNGRLAIGSTSPAYQLHCVGTGYFSDSVTMASGLTVASNAAVNGYFQLAASATPTSSSSIGKLYAYNNAGAQLNYKDGYNTNHALHSASDYRLKENITDYSNDDAVSLVKAAQVKRFDYIEGSEAEENRTNRVGFLAHELQEAGCDLGAVVSLEKDAVDNLGNPRMQSVDYKNLVPVLWAALQDALKRIEDLENK